MSDIVKVTVYSSTLGLCPTRCITINRDLVLCTQPGNPGTIVHLVGEGDALIINETEEEFWGNDH